MFRFTIRDVLWLMVVVAFGVLWQMEVRHRTELTKQLRTLGDVQAIVNRQMQSQFVMEQRVIEAERKLADLKRKNATAPRR